MHEGYLALLKVFVEQGTSLTRVFNPTPTKYIFSLWLLLNIIISTSLKSILSSALIKPKTYDLTTTDELIDHRFMIVVDSWLSDFYKESSQFRNRIFFKLYFVDLLETPDQCRISKAFFEFNVAMVHTEFSLVNLSRSCEKGYPVDKIQNLRFMKDYNVYHAYPMKPDSPYRAVISTTIGRLHSSGLINFWFRNITLESLKVKDMGYTFLKPLTIWHLFTSFVILLGGLSLSLAIFIVEIIIGRKLIKLKRKKA